jgi:hypothetical protein
MRDPRGNSDGLSTSSLPGRSKTRLSQRQFDVKPRSQCYFELEFVRKVEDVYEIKGWQIIVVISIDTF